MMLNAGTRLGPYEILSLIGAGGMGEVYKARDTRLERIVALKVLSAHLADRPEVRERFEREARTVANLKHPHICILHDIGEQDGTHYLVLEYLEGETLAHRLQKGPLPLELVLQYALEISDALDKAHRSGVTHRDIKPGNVMLVPQSGSGPKTGTKVLDFGLAKLKQEVARATIPASEMPTAPGALTGHGTLLGTLQYMSPEQIEGKVEEVDPRTDIFAFGAVVYEMVTGKKAFEGQTQASVIAKILESDPPPMASLQPPGKMTPPALDRVVQRCLAKDREDRWQAMRDVCQELKWIAEGGAQAPVAAWVAARRKIRERLGWAVAAVALLIAAAALTTPLFRRTPEEVASTRFSIPAGRTASPARVAISPDGRRIAYTASGASGGAEQIWIHSLDSLTAQLLRGTEGSTNTFWSPDSRFPAFFAGGKLKRIDILGGAPQTLCDVPTPRSGTWNEEGTILIGSEVGPVSRVPDSGGAPTPVTALNSSRGEIWHGWPQFLPDGRHFLYLARSKELEKSGIYVGSLDSKERKLVLNTHIKAVYAPPGYLFFLREDTLLAQPFDAGRLELIGEPVQVASEITFNPVNGAAAFSVSDSGALAYRTGERRGVQAHLLWADRRGVKSEPLGPVGDYSDPELSPDGKRVAFARSESQGSVDIWLLELSRGTLSRFTFDPRVDLFPLWSPDGNRIIFGSNREGIQSLYQKPSSGASREELLLKTNEVIAPSDWSSDSRFILYEVRNSASATGFDLWVLPLAGEDKKPFPFLQTEFNELHGRFSPDGRWVAYVSNESGRYEVYIRSFPDPTGKWQVSTAGGTQPRWRRDGKELFYAAADRKMMAVPVRSGSTVELGAPVALFESLVYLPGTGLPYWRQQYDVSADGQRFLLNVLVAEAPTSPINVVVNWQKAVTSGK